MSAPVPSPESVPPLREALERARYSAGALMVDLGGDIDTDRGRAPHQSRALSDDDRAQLARLFLLGQPVDAARAGEALAPATVDGLVDAGWLTRDGDAVRCPLRITPHEGVLLVHDPLEIKATDADVVLGRSSAANTLAALTPREHVGSVLDVGTGCGIQALQAAGHADRVVAVDVNQRALDLTALGAALSGIDNVELREGSWFEPVAGEQFDLIVSNPPFVISPESDYVYRDGSGGRDEVSELVVKQAAAHLAPGGIAQVLVNWVEDPFSSWIAPLRRWLDGLPVDALVLHHLSEQPLGYAAKWNMDLHGDPDEHGRVLDRWTAHFEAEGILTIATGAIVLRRTDAGAAAVHRAVDGGRPRRPGRAPHRAAAGRRALAGLGLRRRADGHRAGPGRRPPAGQRARCTTRASTARTRCVCCWPTTPASTASSARPRRRC